MDVTTKTWSNQNDSRPTTSQRLTASCGLRLVASDMGEARLYNQRGGGNSSTGRAPDCGSDGCGFDSRFPPQNFPSHGGPPIPVLSGDALTHSLLVKNRHHTELTT